MKNFPVIETKRLILRELTIDDANDVFDYFSKEEVVKYYDLEKFTKINQVKKLIEQFNSTDDRIRWGLFSKKAKKIIGSCGFHHCCLTALHRCNYKAEIGYELAPEYWQQGFMTEAIKEIIKYGFTELKLNRIEALIIPENIASRKLIAKAGLKEE